MGQTICAIIIKNEVVLDKQTVHFIEDDAIVVPLELHLYVEEFITEAAKFERFEDFLASPEVLAIVAFSESEKDEGENSLKDMIDIIQTYNISDFSVTYYAEWVGIPCEHLFMAVLDGKIIQDSLWYYDHDSEEFKSGEKTEDYYNEKLGLRRTFWANEDRYFDYDTARENYFKSIG